MHLWTIQPVEVVDLVMETGCYRCDPYLSDMLKPIKEELVGRELMKQFADSYDWLVRQMEKRIGPRPEGVIYPVWAWYLYGNRNKPDLRTERWTNGNPGERMACMILEVPDHEVLLSDFDGWHLVLAGLIPISDTEEESDQLDAYMETLTEEKRKTFLAENWERIFDITPFENDWTKRGRYVQATFWELKKEYVTGVRFFTAAGKTIPRRS